MTTKKENTHYNRAVKITASALGALAGVTGIISGYYELQQGNAAPSSLWTSFIGPAYSMYENTAYDVITVVPSFYLTGILALIFSSLALVWSIKYIKGRHGAKIMILLAIAQCLVGGGWVLDIGIFTSILATRIRSPLKWWRKHLPESTGRILARLYPWSLLSYSFLSILLLGATLLGVNNKMVVSLVTPIATTMIIPIPSLILGGIAYDIQQIKGLEVPMESPRAREPHTPHYRFVFKVFRIASITISSCASGSIVATPSPF